MKRLIVCMVVILALAGVVAGCSPAAPAPTQAPAKAAEPTKAPAPTPAQPAAAPAQPTAAQKVDFPQKGKTISAIVPWAAGGGTDVGIRILAAELEKMWGTSVEVINKPGGSSQIGLTDIAKAKPDGYTFGGCNLPTTALTYLDPDRQAPYGRKDFTPLAGFYADPTMIAVRKDVPYKTLQELVDAAKAAPGKIKLGALGVGGDDHMDALRFQQITGVRFAIVQFDGGAPRNAAMVGGNIDVTFGGIATLSALYKSGDIRYLAILDKMENPQAPGTKTAQAQGIDMVSVSYRGLGMPAGVPKDIVDVYAAAIKKVTENPDVIKKLTDTGVTMRYETPESYAKTWDEVEAAEKQAIQLLKEATK